MLEVSLVSLKELHSHGLCHDNIKPDNIFVADTQHWLLGDLGNVRHFGHPWHTSDEWERRGQWAHCQFNDVRRVLKSYLSFIRDSCGDRSAFDQAFYAEERAWSRLYWAFTRAPASVDLTLEMSRTFAARDGWQSGAGTVGVGNGDLCLERAVGLELAYSVHSTSEDWWLVMRC